MLEKIKTIINVEEFLLESRKQGLIKGEEATYDVQVKNLCNNASAYICDKLLDNLNVSELSWVSCHSGYYKHFPHTWIEYKGVKEDAPTIIDLTFAQFDKSAKPLHITEKSNIFQTIDYVNLNDFSKLVNFFNKI